jgi:hypothetical protein
MERKTPIVPLRGVPKEFTNPYAGLHECVRVSVDVSVDDWDTIKSVATQHGALQTLISLWVRKLATEIRRQGWTYGTPELAKWVLQTTKNNP